MGSHIINGLTFKVVSGPAPSPRGRGRVHGSSKYLATIEAARDLRVRQHIIVNAENTKGARLAQAVRQAIKLRLKANEEWKEYEVFTTADEQVAIRRLS